MFRTSLIIGAVAFIGFTAQPSFASHDNYDPDGVTITACVDKKGKIKRLVNDPSQCKKKETVVTWSVVGADGGDTDTEKFLFVTQTMVSGWTIGGLAGGDATCQRDLRSLRLVA